MRAQILSFPSRPVVDEVQPCYDRVHLAILHALRSVHVLTVRQQYHPTIPTFAWDAIEERQMHHAGGEFDVSAFINDQIGAFYDFSDGPAPAGWRLPDDRRQHQQGWMEAAVAAVAR